MDFSVIFLPTAPWSWGWLSP